LKIQGIVDKLFENSTSMQSYTSQPFRTSDPRGQISISKAIQQDLSPILQPETLDPFPMTIGSSNQFGGTKPALRRSGFPGC
jgi:hypothetical protein